MGSQHGLFRPVPGLRRDRLCPSAGALGYSLSPYGLSRLKGVCRQDCLPHKVGTHAALRVDFCAASMPLARSSAMPNAAVTARLAVAPG